jgi:hypothetical protein
MTGDEFAASTAAEYIRADLVPQIDVEKLTKDLDDVLYRAQMLGYEQPGEFRRILTEAMGGQSDE